MKKLRDDWWTQENGIELAAALFRHVNHIASVQSRTFMKFQLLSWMYNPDGSYPLHGPQFMSRFDRDVVENYIATNVATVHAQLTDDVRARFETDDAEWEEQRLAKRLEVYDNDLAKMLDSQEACRRAFKDCALKGPGAVYPRILFDQIQVRRIMIDNVFVADSDCREGQLPRKMHYIEIVSAEEAKARYPNHDEAIERAEGRNSTLNVLTEYRQYPLADDHVVLCEAWHLPIGAKDRPGYKVGRHVVCVDGEPLLDEPYERDHYPIVFINWDDPDSGFYGIGLGERVMRIQHEANKLNKQKARYIDGFCTPIRWVTAEDANLVVQSISRAGALGVYRGQRPYTDAPTAISPDIFNRSTELRQLASFESGVNQMAAHGTKPGGIDSGAGLREYRDQSTQRWASQARKFERFVLEVHLRSLECAKDLGEKAPVMARKTRWGKRYIKWREVEPVWLKVAIAAASALPSSPAGRAQLAMELGQSGIVSKDSARRMMQHADTDYELSLYTASVERIEELLEEALDGEVVIPDPYMNLDIAVWRGTAKIQLSSSDGAPDDVLDVLRQFVDTAAWMKNGQSAPAANVNAGAMPGALPGGMPGALPGGPMPMGPGPAPMASDGAALTGASVAPIQLSGAG